MNKISALVLLFVLFVHTCCFLLTREINDKEYDDDLEKRFEKLLNKEGLNDE